MKDIVRINTDWNSLASIKLAEQKKTRLENKGYTLIHSSSGMFNSLLVYVIKKSDSHG